MKTKRKLAVIVMVLGFVNSAIANWVVLDDNMYTDIAGNVGIGTASPDEKLTVEGRIKAEKIIESIPVFVYPPESEPERYVHGVIYGDLGWWRRITGKGISTDDTFSQSAGYLGAYKLGQSHYPGPGENQAKIFGVYGEADSHTDTIKDYGGYFEAHSDYGIGVYGEATSPSIVNGKTPQTYGGYFVVRSEAGTGVFGKAGSGTGVRGEGDVGVYGKASYGGEGLYGVTYGDGKGVYGKHTESDNEGSLGNKTDGVLGHSNSRWGRGVYGTASGESGFGVRGDGNGPLGRGVYGKGTSYDFYAGGDGKNYGPFTGAHEAKLAEDFPEDVRLGMVVSVTGRAEMRYDEDGAISISSTLPTVALSNVENDSAVLGAFAGYELLDQEHWYTIIEGERFGSVNALGEGRVWVSDINGKVQVGDYITTSSIPGYGQRQNDDLLRACTLGKAIENVDWASVVETIDFDGHSYKVYLIAVIYTSG